MAFERTAKVTKDSSQACKQRQMAARGSRESLHVNFRRPSFLITRHRQTLSNGRSRRRQHLPQHRHTCLPPCRPFKHSCTSYKVPRKLLAKSSADNNLIPVCEQQLHLVQVCGRRPPFWFRLARLKSRVELAGCCLHSRLPLDPVRWPVSEPALQPTSSTPRPLFSSASSSSLGWLSLSATSSS